MPQAAAADSGIEYSIYTFEKGEGRWQMHGMTNDMQKALTSAEQLLDTGKYEKIEVKQKYFDKKTNRVVDMSLKVLVYKAKSSVLPLIGLVFLALLAGGGSFAAAYFLTQDKSAPTATESAAPEAH
ncbi:MAG: hypothetical protein KJ667_09250 [Alphaproteobacteria bacterium]|nr:hypothetical protein [Alphaproteobacteria bacterium]